MKMSHEKENERKLKLVVNNDRRYRVRLAGQRATEKVEKKYRGDLDRVHLE